MARMRLLRLPPPGGSLEQKRKALQRFNFFQEAAHILYFY